MNRLGLLYPDELDAEAKALYDVFERHVAVRDRNAYVCNLLSRL